MNRNLFRSGALLLGAIVGFASLTLAAENKTDAAGPSAVVMTITATAKKMHSRPHLPGTTSHSIKEKSACRWPT
jgi:hypothetical protein